MPDSVPPRWSVVIPVAGRAKYLGETLASVLSQDPGPENMQIRIIDNSKAGETAVGELAAQYAPRVEYHRHPQQLPMVENWNSCVEQARGELIHLLHDDDYVLPGFYARMDTLWRTRPDAGAAISRYLTVNEEGDWLAVSPLHQPTSGIFEDAAARIYLMQTIQCPSIVVAAASYQALGRFDTQFTHAQDLEMWIRVAAARPILFETTPCACYRVHRSSMTSRHLVIAENYRDIERVIRHTNRLLPEARRKELLNRSLAAYTELALKDAYGNIWRKNYDVAAAQLGVASSMAPSFKDKFAVMWAKLRLFEQRLRNRSQPAQ